MLNIYTENEHQNFSLFVESGLINIVQQKPNIYVLIESKTCACNTRDGIAVNEWSIFITDYEKYVKSYEYYFVNCNTKEEVVTAIFWLLKSYFQTFIGTRNNPLYNKNKSVPLDDENKPVEKKICKYIYEKQMSERFFYIYYEKCGCIKYELMGDPIYCLKSIVVSPRTKGPTVKSVV